MRDHGFDCIYGLVSKSSKVFMITVVALEALCASLSMKLSMMSSGSVVLLKDGRSRRRILFIPGIPSMGVSRDPFIKKFSYMHKTERTQIS